MSWQVMLLPFVLFLHPSPLAARKGRFSEGVY